MIQSNPNAVWAIITWEYAEYIFHLINHYLRNGATAYTYWNMILDDQDSTWGWWQNSLFTITADTHEVRRNPEYYVMRHFSHFVKPGAHVLGTTGHFNSMAIAFRNPDGTIVVVAQNALEEERPFEFCRSLQCRPRYQGDAWLRVRSTRLCWTDGSCLADANVCVTRRLGCGSGL